jgi:hypothetical protein
MQFIEKSIADIDLTESYSAPGEVGIYPSNPVCSEVAAAMEVISALDSFGSPFSSVQNEHRDTVPLRAR